MAHGSFSTKTHIVFIHRNRYSDLASRAGFKYDGSAVVEIYELSKGDAFLGKRIDRYECGSRGAMASARKRLAARPPH